MVKNFCLPISSYELIKKSIDENKEAHLHGRSIEFNVGDDMHIFEMKEGYRIGDPAHRKDCGYTGRDFFVHISCIRETKTKEGRKVLDMTLIPR